MKILRLGMFSGSFVLVHNGPLAVVRNANAAESLGSLHSVDPLGVRQVPASLFESVAGLLDALGVLAKGRILGEAHAAS